MISVIVCSRSKEAFEALAANVAATIGLPHEVVRVDNSTRRYSLCAAYNAGADKAKFSYLCFAHEDIAFMTEGWGQKIIDHFNADDNIGLLGVAGGIYKSRMASGWWQFESNSKDVRRMNIIQAGDHLLYNPHNELRSEVVSIDGVFLATKKQVFDQYRFDEALTGFHGYDLDYSMQVSQEYKLAIVYDVLIDHQSTGNDNIKWMEAMLAVHKKWKSRLPATLASADNNFFTYNSDWRLLRRNMASLFKYNLNLWQLVRFYNGYFSLLDQKPNLLACTKDYLKGLVWLVRQYAQQNNSSPRVVLAK
ncbi:glycosyltransferase [Aridibaculum aurantiacum]|uniref:glycosyltransferase n=1 Tax=Aridibaculum aurantiacum TaxID=2810307 RepID=UPI001A961591|nr:glycosyltransferase [Aridibaculum aurantiacum]